MSPEIRSFSIFMLTGLTTIRADSGHTSSRTPRPVFPQSGTGLHDIYDDLGKAHDGRQLDGTVELDNLHRLMLPVIKIIFGDLRVFGGYADALMVFEKFCRLCRARTHMRQQPKPRSSTS